MSYILLGDYMKIIKYLGLFLLICFTFFYTEKVVNVINNNDELTQKEIAKKLHISRSYVSRIEKRALIKMLREFIRNNNI